MTSKQKYGPKTEQVEAFLTRVRSMTEDQRRVVNFSVSEADPVARNVAGYATRDIAGDAVWGAAWDAAQDAAWAAAWGAARGAVLEIVGADELRERYGEPFFFLPMFGINNPEELTQNDNRH